MAARNDARGWNAAACPTAKKKSSANGLVAPPVEAHSTVMIAIPQSSASQASSRLARPRDGQHQRRRGQHGVARDGRGPGGEETSGSRNDVAISARRSGTARRR